MERLGYERYVSQGGDHGSVVSDVMARQAPLGLLGIHVTMPATVPADVAKALNDSDPAPSGLSDAEQAAFAQLDAFYKKGCGYSAMMGTGPQTLGYGLADSPAGQAAWMYDKFAAWTDSGGDPQRVLLLDDMLDDISLYRFADSATSAAQLYWENNENNGNNFNAVDISLPAAITVFPGEIYRAPRSWPSAATTISSIGTKPRPAGTSQPGSSRQFSLTRSGQRLDRCDDWMEGNARKGMAQFSSHARQH
jgi:hypothetical protein